MQVHDGNFHWKKQQKGLNISRISNFQANMKRKEVFKEQTIPRHELTEMQEPEFDEELFDGLESMDGE